MKMAPIQP